MKFCKIYLLSLLSASIGISFSAFPSDLLYEEEEKNLYAPAISYSASAPFITSKKSWEEGKVIFETHVKNLRKHDHRELRLLFDILLRVGTVGNIHYVQKNILEELSLEVLITPETVAHFYLLNAFDKSIPELFDIGNEMIQKSLYLKADLKILLTYFLNACATLKNVEFIINNIFLDTPDHFNLEEFTHQFQKIRRIPEQKINDYLKRYIQKIRDDKKGVLSVYDYIKFYTQSYYLLFMNHYIFIQSHLKDVENLDRKLLHRNLSGRLKRYKHHFESIFLPSSGEVKPSTAPQKIPLTLNIAPPLEEEKGLPSQEKENKENRVNSMKFASEKIDPLFEDLSQPFASSLEASSSFTPESVPQTLPPPIFQRALPLKVPSSSSSIPLKREIEETLDAFDELETILNQFEDGAYAGMKTRHFLNLANALNSLGYFSGFAANNKEIRIKINSTPQTPGIVSVLHTNHSNKAKDAGITGPTARKMNEIIHLLKDHIKSITLREKKIPKK